MTPDAILLDIVKKCGRFGVSVLVADSDKVDCDGIWTSGWFCEDTKTLAVAIGLEPKHWVEVLLHEYCHVQQWVEQCDVWRKVDKHTVQMQDWLDGTPCRNIKQVAADTRDMEMDCERRTYRLALELDAPIDLKEHARRANAYGHYHNVAVEVRKWFPKERGIYQSPSILPLFNATIDTEFKTNAAQRKALLSCLGE